MNKNLFEDENELLEIHSSGKTAYENAANPRYSKTGAADDLLEIPGLEVAAPQFAPTPESTRSETIDSEPDEFSPNETVSNEISPNETGSNDETLNVEPANENKIGEISTAEENHAEIARTENLQPTSAPVESAVETARGSGLAYGAAITLFGSVIVLLVLGWFADRVFGTSPWGIVGGIFLGAAIGFYQFFKINSQIFKK